MLFDCGEDVQELFDCGEEAQELFDCDDEVKERLGSGWVQRLSERYVQKGLEAGQLQWSPRHLELGRKMTLNESVWWGSRIIKTEDMLGRDAQLATERLATEYWNASHLGSERVWYSHPG